MNFRQKIGQLIFPRLEGNSLSDNEYFNNRLSLIDAGIGGFILFGGKIPETPIAIKRLREKAKTPFLITSDIERGLGQQLAGGTRFLNQWGVAEAIDRENSEDVGLLRDMLNAVQEECIAAGIHVVFSPVADVNVNPDNPIICTRSFGEDTEKVSWFVKEYVKGLQKSSVGANGHMPLLACAKHFPGHGNTAVDSHTSLPVINANRERLEKVELSPFKAAIDAGVAMIMIGHLKVPELEPESIPATFSKRIVTDLLRGEMRFNGVIVTDALDMGALKSICDEGEAAVRCLAAGCDILLHLSEPLKALEAIAKAVEDGRLSYERVNEAFKRVMGIKNQCSVADAQRPEIGSQQSKDIAHEIARKAIKFGKGRGLSSSENIACLIIDDDGYEGIAAPFLVAMKDRLADSRVVTSYSDIRHDETAILPIFSRVSAWKGSSGLSKGSSEKVKSAIIRARRSVLISFGSPYILNSFDADVMINAFDPADFMQRAAVERLVTG